MDFVCKETKDNAILNFSAGSLINVERSKPDTEDILKTESGSGTENRALDFKALKRAVQGQKAKYGDESPNSHDLTSSSNGTNGTSKWGKQGCCWQNEEA